MGRKYFSSFERVHLDGLSEVVLGLLMKMFVCGNMKGNTKDYELDLQVIDGISFFNFMSNYMLWNDLSKSQTL